jgi:hypothetical protein
MEEDYDELFTAIYEKVMEGIIPTSQDEILFLHTISLRATSGAREFLEELTEANKNLRETIKRLNNTEDLRC